MNRSLAATILKERISYQKMIFVAGPRQVGKTTVLGQLREHFPGPLLNWDNLEDRAKITYDAAALFETSSDIYLDEIHKYPRWKNFLKGNFDKYGDTCRITVTGSSRLDVYRRGGDSMMGRYLLFRLHPLSVGELENPQRVPAEVSIDSLINPDVASSSAKDAWRQLSEFGGFPEPFLRQEQTFHRRWLSMRHERLVREDIRDTTRLRELALLEQMIVMLPARVAQPFSLNALREDLGVSHDSVTLWTKTLEEFYYLFLIPAYSKKLSRASKKERKLYLWDYSELRSPGEKFENMIASHLLKWSHCARDLGYAEIDLRFIKNKEKKEVDFLILRDRKAVLLIEAKYADPTPTAASIALSAQLGGIPVIHVVDSDDILSHRTIREGQHKISWTLTSAAGLCQHLP